MASLLPQLQGFRLTTAEILYHLPDYPDVLQLFLWQELDIPPQFPKLKKFLDFWEHNLDGKLNSVTIAHSDHLRAQEWFYHDGEFRIH